jgi:hypothetical protein
VITERSGAPPSNNYSVFKDLTLTVPSRTLYRLNASAPMDDEGLEPHVPQGAPGLQPGGSTRPPNTIRFLLLRLPLALKRQKASHRYPGPAFVDPVELD